MAGVVAALGVLAVWPPVALWNWRNMGENPVRWPSPTSWSEAWSGLRAGDATVAMGPLALALVLGLLVGLGVWSAWGLAAGWRGRRKAG